MYRKKSYHSLTFVCVSEKKPGDFPMAGRVSGERAGKCVILNADTFHRFGKNMENTERTYLFEQAPVPRARLNSADSILIYHSPFPYSSSDYLSYIYYTIPEMI